MFFYLLNHEDIILIDFIVYLFGRSGINKTSRFDSSTDRGKEIREATLQAVSVFRNRFQSRK